MILKVAFVPGDRLAEDNGRHFSTEVLTLSGDAGQCPLRQVQVVEVVEVGVWYHNIRCVS
jgi:hypothetical protein